MKPLTILLLLLSACTMRTYDCDVTDIEAEATREIVLEEFPDVENVFDGMDVFCVEDTDTFQTCARAGYEHTEGCTAWLGSGPYRGRVYLDLDEEDFDALMLHEAQHWHLMLVHDDDGCPTHEAACGWKE
jgi:hypothetical protein